MSDAEKDPENPPSLGTVDESTLEPMPRDGRFIYRLVLGVFIAIAAVVVIGGWMRGAAAHCGASLVRPGGTVIPPH